MEKLREQYKNEVIPAMMKKFNYKSVMEVPKLDKIVLNVGLGDIKDNPKSLENAMNDIKQITGQQPIVTKAKKAIAAFKIREGVKKYFYRKNRRTCAFLAKLDDELTKYIGGLGKNILIQVIEYTLAFLIIGHPNYLILGIISPSFSTATSL